MTVAITVRPPAAGALGAALRAKQAPPTANPDPTSTQLPLTTAVTAP